ncbi:MAG: hypothetical protein RLO18_33315, partial [Gimesia chilikensis]
MTAHQAGSIKEDRQMVGIKDSQSQAAQIAESTSEVEVNNFAETTHAESREKLTLTSYHEVFEGKIPPPVPPAGGPNVPETDSSENPLTPTSQTMTLEELEQIALSNNPTMALQRAEIEKERGNWTQAGLYPNPTVGYVNSTASSNGDTQSNGILVQ